MVVAGSAQGANYTAASISLSLLDDWCRLLREYVYKIAEVASLLVPHLSKFLLKFCGTGRYRLGTQDRRLA